MTKNRKPGDTTALGAPASQGQSKLLDQAYRRHWAYLCQVLRRRFGEGPPEPEDAVQSAFIKFAQLENPADITDQRGFLYTVARNLILDAKRRHSRHEHYVDQAMQAAGIEALEEIGPERVTIERERFAVINHLIDKLPAKQRRLLMLNRIQGESYDKIAQLTGYSPADISRQINRALAALQQGLEQATGTNDNEAPQ